MNIPTEDLWAWLKTAPLPVVLAINLLVAVWVYGLSNRIVSSETRSQYAQAVDDRHDANFDKLTQRMDKMLEIIERIDATQKYMGWQPPAKPADKKVKE